MKKFLFGLLFLPISVLAVSPSVLSIDTSVDSNRINYSGTTEGDVYAVMCKLYKGDTEIDMLSSAVSNNQFEGSFDVKNDGDYKVSCADYDGGSIKSKSVSLGSEKYTVSSDDVVVTFSDVSGQTFEGVIIDFLTADKDFLVENGVSLDEFEIGMKKINEVLKDDGSLLAVYGIEIKNTNGFDKKEGSFDIKIKMTDEMKKFNSFKLVYIDEQNNFSKGEEVLLTVDGDYLVGTLPHLSVYALVGSVKENSIVKTNPKTGDNMAVYVGVLALCSAGVVVLKKEMV